MIALRIGPFGDFFKDLDGLIKGKIFDCPILRFFPELKYLDSKNEKKFGGPWTGHRGDPSPLNISGTDEYFDTRSSRSSQDRSPLHSHQFSSKSLE